MSKYTSHVQTKDTRQWKVHPIWRGFGCLMLILLPIMSFAGAKIITQEQLLPFTPDLTAPVRLPYLDYSFLSFPIDMNVLIDWLPQPPLLISEVLMIGALIFLGFGALTVVYSFLYRSFGPPKSVFDDPRLVNPQRRRRY